MNVRVASTLAIVFFTAAAGARAQEGLATSSTLMGHNTIQQAPSGGRVQKAPLGDPEGRTIQGRPTPPEWKVEQRNDEITSICKGC